MVDAILGYSITGPPRDDVARLIGFVHLAGRPVISLDVPSGLDPVTGTVAGVAVVATATMTVALPKLGLFEAAGPAHAGRLYLADIGLPPGLYQACASRSAPSSPEAGSSGWMIDEQLAALHVARREARPAQ